MQLRLWHTLEQHELVAAAALEMAFVKVHMRAQSEERFHQLSIGRQIVNVVAVAAQKVFAPTP